MELGGNTNKILVEDLVSNYANLVLRGLEAFQTLLSKITFQFVQGVFSEHFSLLSLCLPQTLGGLLSMAFV